MVQADRVEEEEVQGEQGIECSVRDGFVLGYI
jgi:hypothetical protein